MRSRSASLVLLVVLSPLFWSCKKAVGTPYSRVDDSDVQVIRQVIPAEDRSSHGEYDKLGLGQLGPDQLKSSKDSELSSQNLENMKAALRTNFQSGLVKLEGLVFQAKSREAEFVGSVEFSWFLQLYATALLNPQSVTEISESAEDSIKSMKSLAIDSMNRFDQELIQPCIENDRPRCRVIQRSFGKVKDLSSVVSNLSDLKEDRKDQLLYLGVAIELSTGTLERPLSRGESSDLLMEKYLDFSLEYLSRASFKGLSPGLRSRTIENINFLLLSRDWSLVTQGNIDLVIKLKPWLVTDDDDLAFAKSRIAQYLPLYAENSIKIDADLSAYITTQFHNMVENGVDLFDYPAFENVYIERIFVQNPSVQFLLYMVFFGKLGLNEASLYIDSEANKVAFLRDLFESAKLLVRWHIAQLSLTSARELASKLSAEPIKNAEAYGRVIDKEGQALETLWNHFHGSQLRPLQLVIEASARHIKPDALPEISRFFSSIDRNILKLSVYPNMLALAYDMGVNRVEGSIPTGRGLNSIQPRFVMDQLMAGEIFQPWFFFTNLSNSGFVYSRDSEEALKSQELLDAIYYFFATKTHEIYNIRAGDLLNEMTLRLLGERTAFIESTVLAQDQVYNSNTSEVAQYISWCRALQSGNASQARETLSFNTLYKQLTPHTKKLSTSPLKSEGSLLFYSDSYKDTIGLNSSFLTNTEGMDRIFTEVRPILGVLNSVIGIAERLGPEIVDLEFLNESSQSVREAEHLVKKFWGSLFMAEKRMGPILDVNGRHRYKDCPEFTQSEIRRRAVAILEREKYYLTHLVWPVLEKTSSGEISDKEAMKLLKDIQLTPEGFEDEITFFSNGRVQYKANHLSFMLRVRQYLLDGLQVDHEELGQHDLPPILGRNRLTIDLPADLYNRDSGANPYLEGFSEYRKPFVFNIYHGEQNLEVADITDGTSFGNFVTPRLSDRIRKEIGGDNRFTIWNGEEASLYQSALKHKVAYYTQLHMASPVEYLDFENTNCRTLAEAPASCIKVREFDFFDLTRELVSVFESNEITGVNKEYLDITSNDSLLNRDSLEGYVEFDRKFTDVAHPGGNTKALRLPYTDISGLYDTSVSMAANKDYLGLLYQSDFNIHENGDILTPKCSTNRDGCRWPSDRQAAVDFFHARRHRGLIFNMDRQVLEEGFSDALGRLQNRHKLLYEIEDDEGATLALFRQGKPKDFLFDRLRYEPSELIPISLKKKNVYEIVDRFYREKTLGFYFKDPTKLINQYLILE